jgi:ubiquinone/menaquinone biosynthesis C-methylase UbiE
MNSDKKDVENFFDNDSNDYLRYKYHKNNYSFMAIRKTKVINLLNKFIVNSFDQCKHILDAGCGPGILLDFFNNFNINYIGLDLSTEMISIARKQIGIKPYTSTNFFLRGDIEKLPFSNDSFNIVISLGVIEYLPNDNKLLAEFYRVIKPKGFLLISVTNKYSYNLILDDFIEYLRKKRLSVRLINFLKQKFQYGQFKERNFSIRKHSPREFIHELEQHNFTIIESVFFGLNILPYPLNLIFGNKMNYQFNKMFNNINHNFLKSLSEGYLVLCKSNKPDFII